MTRFPLLASAALAGTCGALALGGQVDLAGLLLNGVAAGAAFLPQRLKLEGETAVRSVAPLRSSRGPAPGVYVVTRSGSWEPFPKGAATLLDHPRPLNDPRGDALWYGELTLVEIGEKRMRMMLRPSSVSEAAAVTLLACLSSHGDLPCTIRQFDEASGPTFLKASSAVPYLSERLAGIMSPEAAEMVEEDEADAPAPLRQVARIMHESRGDVIEDTIRRIGPRMMARSSIYTRGLGRPKVAYIGRDIKLWKDWPKQAVGKPFDADHPYPAVVGITGRPVEDVSGTRYDRIRARIDGEVVPYHRVLAAVKVDGRPAIWNATVRG